MSDGPQVFTSNEFNSWLKDNKITHRVSSPGRARSNGAIESKIKLYKSIRDKLVTDGKYSPGAMQEAWAILNNIVEIDDANSKFYFRLVKIDPDQVAGSFEVQKVKLNFIVRSCMKGIKSSVREKRTVSFAD